MRVLVKRTTRTACRVSPWASLVLASSRKRATWAWKRSSAALAPPAWPLACFTRSRTMRTPMYSSTAAMKSLKLRASGR